MKIFYAILFLALFTSCSTLKKSGRIKQSSVFANVNEIGTEKTEFLRKYGQPLNKDVLQENGENIENLYYVEVIDRLIVTTKFRFENGKMTAQSNQKIEYSDSKRLKELQDEVQRTRLQSFMNQMSN